MVTTATHCKKKPETSDIRKYGSGKKSLAEKHVILVRLFGSVVEPALKPPSFQPLTCQGIAPSIGRRRKHSFFLLLGGYTSQQSAPNCPGKNNAEKKDFLAEDKHIFNFSLILQ
jgi:hypothetical protein